ncbi:fish-egg lectin-like [Engystomops pustulosus]|uniref:fish-egg lectin-like n=1 Tax=Engystomops pustulosus TaxID=76066 RepID=UPI003AFA20D5
MMLILGVFLLFVSGDAQDLTPDCTVIPGKLRQISCGFGQVYGVNNANNVFYRMNNKWEQVPGQLLSVATGPGGTWGINPKYNIYRLQGSTWMQVTGSLLQLDSGGFQFLAGVTLDNKAVCLNQDDTLSGKSEVTFITYNLDLKYIACTQSVCWGVNSTNDVLLITGVQPYRCQGSGSQVVPGQKLYVITVSYDGSVFGLSPGGLIYRR